MNSSSRLGRTRKTVNRDLLCPLPIPHIDIFNCSQSIGRVFSNGRIRKYENVQDEISRIVVVTITHSTFIFRMKIVSVDKALILRVRLIMETRRENDCLRLYTVPVVSLDIMAYGIWEN